MANNHNSNAPLISFVFMTRNDGYTKGFTEKVQRTLNLLSTQAERYEVPIELVLVEWNPPQDRPPFKEALEAVGNDYSTIRIVTVPSEFHKGFRGASEKGIHMIRSLNVGIRRATGSFITPIASDAILSNQVFDFFAQETLSSDKVYRLDRCDVDSDRLQSAANNSLDKQLQACEEGIIARHTSLGKYLVEDYGLIDIHTNGCGDFTLMSKQAWHAMHGYKEDVDIACLDGDGIGLTAAVCSGLQQCILPEPCVVYKEAHAKMSARRTIVSPCKSNKIKWGFINWISTKKETQRYLMELLDYPRREVKGLKGTFKSMDSNYVAPAKKWIKNMPQQVILSSPEWGLGKHTLPEHIMEKPAR